MTTTMTTTTTLQKKQLSNEDSSTSKPKERRIVTWTQEEDDTLREQIGIHGTENWTIIASKFNDKTTRQCRRRWYTYLNSDFKKGGWSPEEDMLLCEAQKIFGNRWTEIAKMVSGRTDNAVKNRFTTLCKKRAKREALAKENNTTFINVNSKRVLIDSGFHSQGVVDVALPLKKLRRAHILNAIVNGNSMNVLQKECEETKPQLRPPFAVLAQNVDNVDDSQQVSSNKEGLINGDNKTEGTYIRKDDPKVAALMQQAELLSSLAVKVNMGSTDQNLECAWKVLQNFTSKSKDSEEVKYRLEDVDLQLDDLKDLVELRSSNEGNQPLQRDEVYQSPSSSEYSTGSTILSTSASDHKEQFQAEICSVHDDIGSASQSVQIGDNDGVNMSGNEVLPCATTDQEFSSPIQVTPIFRSLASTIPSPQFSESERHFLLKTLGIESPAPNTINNPLEPPPCRKALLQGL